MKVVLITAIAALLWCVSVASCESGAVIEPTSLVQVNPLEPFNAEGQEPGAKREGRQTTKTETPPPFSFDEGVTVKVDASSTEIKITFMKDGKTSWTITVTLTIGQPGPISHRFVDKGINFYAKDADKRTFKYEYKFFGTQANVDFCSDEIRGTEYQFDPKTLTLIGTMMTTTVTGTKSFPPKLVKNQADFIQLTMGPTTNSFNVALDNTPFGKTKGTANPGLVQDVLNALGK